MPPKAKGQSAQADNISSLVSNQVFLKTLKESADAIGRNLAKLSHGGDSGDEEDDLAKRKTDAARAMAAAAQAAELSSSKQAKLESSRSFKISREAEDSDNDGEDETLSDEYQEEHLDDDFLNFTENDLHEDDADEFELQAHKTLVASLFDQMKVEQRVDAAAGIELWLEEVRKSCHDESLIINELEDVTILAGEGLDSKRSEIAGMVANRNVINITAMRNFLDNVTNDRSARLQELKLRDKTAFEQFWEGLHGTTESYKKRKKEELEKSVRLTSAAQAFELTGDKSVATPAGYEEEGESKASVQEGKQQLASQMLQVIASQQDEIAYLRSLSEIGTQAMDALKLSLSYVRKMKIETIDDEKGWSLHDDTSADKNVALHLGQVMGRLQMQVFQELLDSKEGRDQVFRSVEEEAAGLAEAHLKQSQLDDEVAELREQAQQLRTQIKQAPTGQARCEELKKQISAAKDAQQTRSANKRKALIAVARMEDGDVEEEEKEFTWAPPDDDVRKEFENNVFEYRQILLESEAVNMVMLANLQTAKDNASFEANQRATGIVIFEDTEVEREAIQEKLQAAQLQLQTLKREFQQMNLESQSSQKYLAELRQNKEQASKDAAEERKKETKAKLRRNSQSGTRRSGVDASNVDAASENMLAKEDKLVMRPEFKTKAAEEDYRQSLFACGLLDKKGEPTMDDEITLQPKGLDAATLKALQWDLLRTNGKLQTRLGDLKAKFQAAWGSELPLPDGGAREGGGGGGGGGDAPDLTRRSPRELTKQLSGLLGVGTGQAGSRRASKAAEGSGITEVAVNEKKSEKAVDDKEQQKTGASDQRHHLNTKQGESVKSDDKHPDSVTQPEADLDGRKHEKHKTDDSAGQSAAEAVVTDLGGNRGQVGKVAICNTNTDSNRKQSAAQLIAPEVPAETDVKLMALLTLWNELSELNVHVEDVTKRIHHAKVAQQLQPTGPVLSATPAPKVSDEIPPENREMRRVVNKQQKDLNSLRKKWWDGNNKASKGDVESVQVQAAVKLLLQKPPPIPKGSDDWSDDSDFGEDSSDASLKGAATNQIKETISPQILQRLKAAGRLGVQLATGPTGASAWPLRTGSAEGSGSASQGAAEPASALPS
ncbi:unnamed protein product [Polarella glacialis]|uniref:Uncharacterized protein n=1 Tax=Polarella glacialis TaxID=89957 RepID=A0A813I7Q9_POLGL|nr:unnamed protein product [Polarella glacialis]